MRSAQSNATRLGILTLGTILFVLYLARLDWNALSRAAGTFPREVMVAVVALNLATGLLKYGRWSRLLARRGVTDRGSLLEEYLAINAGFFLGLVTPGTSGELARGALSGVPASRAVAIVGFEKVMDLGLLLLMVAGSAVVQFTSGGASWTASAAILVSTVAAYFLFLRFDTVATAPFRWLLGRFGSERQFAVARNVYWEFFELLRDRKALIGSAAFSACLWVLPVAQMHLILNGLENQVPLKTSAFVFLFPYLLGVLSMIPAGIGAFDITADHVGTRALAIAGAAGQGGSFAPLLFRLLVTIPLIAFGYICHVALNLRRRSGPGQ